MNTSPSSTTWCSFENISSGADAAAAAASCTFSLSTLEIAAAPGAAVFGVTERKQPETWRWAVIGGGGFLLEEGFEPTQADAKRAAEDALQVLMVAKCTS